MAVSSRSRMSCWRARWASKPRASARRAAVAAANWLQTMRRGARFVAPAGATAAPAASTRARRWAGGSVTVANGIRSSVARRRRTSSPSAGSAATRRSNDAASSGESSPSTYSTAMSLGGVMSSLHQIRERLTQAEEAAATPALDGPEGRVEGRRDLRLREALVVDHLEGAALVRGQPGQGVAHAQGGLARRDPLGRARWPVGRRGAQPGGAEDAETPPPAAQPIDGPGTRERRQESAEGAAAHIECRALDEHHEDLLREVLRLLLRLKDGAREPVDEAAVAIVERSERGAIGPEGPEENVVRRLSRGHLVVFGPAHLEALASIVGRPGASHTVSSTPGRGPRMHGPGSSPRRPGGIASPVQPWQSPRMPDYSLFGDEHVRQYEATGGKVGHDWNGTTCLILHTTGRKSGETRKYPLIYGRDGDNYVLVASKGGAPGDPGWYKNLVAHPDVRIQVRDKVLSVRARTGTPADKRRVWPIMTKQWPDYDKYQAGTKRDIPVVLLSPR